MPSPAPDHAYAGLVSRLASLATDLGLVAATAAAVRILPDVVWRDVTARPTPAWLSLACGTAAAVLPWAYFTLCWWLAGQTVGNLLLGITLRSRDGGEVSLVQAALRAAFGLLLSPLWMVGLLAILWDHRRRAWHDVAFRTVVPYATRRTAAASPQ